MTTPLSPEVLAAIDALPDEALVEASRSPGYYRISLPKPGYVSDPDFSHCGSLADTAKAIRADLRGEGKYAPHFDTYAVEYRLLPHWRKRAEENKTEAPQEPAVPDEKELAATAEAAFDYLMNVAPAYNALTRAVVAFEKLQTRERWTVEQTLEHWHCFGGIRGTTRLWYRETREALKLARQNYERAFPDEASEDPADWYSGGVDWRHLMRIALSQRDRF